MSKFEPQYTHGYPIEDCMPVVVDAQVIRIRSEIDKTEYLNFMDQPKTSESIEGFKYVFEFELNDGTYQAETYFERGNVVPALGGWVRGVAVQNQWATYQFVLTHIYKNPVDKDPLC